MWQASKRKIAVIAQIVVFSHFFFILFTACVRVLSGGPYSARATVAVGIAECRALKIVVATKVAAVGGGLCCRSGSGPVPVTPSMNRFSRASVPQLSSAPKPTCASRLK